MKKLILFQVVVIFLILVAWNMLHLGFDFQKKFHQNQIGEIPVVLFADKLDSLEMVRTALDSLSYIREIKIEKSSEIADKLIKLYNLNDASEVLEKHSLPNIMHIYVIGRMFDQNKKNELFELISSSSKNVKYNNGLWQISRRKLNFLNKIYLVFNGIFVVLVLGLTVFLRMNFENRTNRFWEIFKRSGGKIGARNRKYIIHSLFLIFIPVILSFSIYFGARYFDKLDLFIPYICFGLEAFILLMSVLIVRLILRKKF